MIDHVYSSLHYFLIVRCMALLTITPEEISSFNTLSVLAFEVMRVPTHISHSLLCYQLNVPFRDIVAITDLAQSTFTDAYSSDERLRSTGSEIAGIDDLDLDEISIAKLRYLALHWDQLHTLEHQVLVNNVSIIFLNLKDLDTYNKETGFKVLSAIYSIYGIGYTVPSDLVSSHYQRVNCPIDITMLRGIDFFVALGLVLTNQLEGLDTHDDLTAIIESTFAESRFTTRARAIDILNILSAIKDKEDIIATLRSIAQEVDVYTLVRFLAATHSSAGNTFRFNDDVSNLIAMFIEDSCAKEHINLHLYLAYHNTRYSIRLSELLQQHAAMRLDLNVSPEQEFYYVCALYFSRLAPKTHDRIGEAILKYYQDFSSPANTTEISCYSDSVNNGRDRCRVAAEDLEEKAESLRITPAEWILAESVSDEANERDLKLLSFMLYAIDCHPEAAWEEWIPAKSPIRTRDGLKSLLSMLAHGKTIPCYKRQIDTEIQEDNSILLVPESVSRASVKAQDKEPKNPKWIRWWLWIAAIYVLLKACG
jgi:hypothetical protein